MSTETEYWIKGFLSGNEPDAPTDEEGDTIFSGEEYIQLFHKNGHWYSGDRFCGLCGNKLYNSKLGLVCESCEK